MAYALRASIRIELQEYGEPVVLQAKYIDLDILAEANKHWRNALGLSGDPVRVENIGNGLLKLRAEAVTGVVRVGRMDIEIAPKFLGVAGSSWQTVLWRILSVVEGGYIDDNLTAAHQLASLPIPDLLAEIFLASYAKGAARGLPRGYLSEQGAGNILRGNLDTSRLGEWIAKPWVLPYVADLLTDDTALARLLRWSAECLATTVKVPGRSHALREISSVLAHVGKRPPHLLEAQRIYLGPQHQGLKAALVIGLLLLQGAGVHHASGEYSLSGFLWNSDTIYENYVYWLCQRAASRRGKRVNKSEIKFGQIVRGSGGMLKTTPDVVFYENSVPVAVTDAKYKHIYSQPKAQDTYQVLTAGHILGCRRVSLTYPVAIDREPTVWSVPSALGGHDIELTVLPINLMRLTLSGGQEALIDRIGAWLEGEYIRHSIDS
ncbi:TPA: hypothetical protein M5M69_000692 [Citrobacter freundii]|uniref:McrC family protein n=1 Tax=Citrobacter TaxID=544 RepID=UPI001B80F7A4|nr:hypothetical protein [Citrobacter sp. Cf236]HBB9908905.1 hypothetical protein [Citrobacter freundii]MDM3056756.1 McrC family protein [Citrobacter sp. Cf236]HBC2002770.1 hypothetical protein [Citrobacter freundii]HBM8408060.1 hypothetical protein [Citrobacter freundii]HBM9445763.1 hypothetical protein [Citrobacter freundii]